jgi:hypothetical protein
MCGNRVSKNTQLLPGHCYVQYGDRANCEGGQAMSHRSDACEISYSCVSISFDMIISYSNGDRATVRYCISKCNVAEICTSRTVHRSGH